MTDTTRDPFRKTFRLLTAEGFLSEVFVTLTGGVFLTGLALLLGADPVTLSLLAALPVLAQVSQFFAPLAESKLGTRRRFVVPSFALGRSLWLVPAGLVAAGLSGPGPLAVTMVAVFAMASFIMLAANGWLTWMSDVIPQRVRGRQFGRRAWGAAAGTLVAAPLGALLIDQLGQRGQAPLAFGILGATATAAGLGAAFVVARFPAPPPTLRPPEPIRRALPRLVGRKDFRRVLLFFAGWNAAVGLPAPFWTLYMLEWLDMSFFLITMHTVAVLAVRLLTNNFWSRLIDRIGSQRVLLGCGLGASLVPLIWLFPGADRIWPLFVEAVVSGTCWTGFNQAAFVQPIGLLEPADRPRGLALFNVVSGGALFAAALLGGWFLHTIGTDTRTGFFALFVTSSVLRVSSIVTALRLAEPDMTVTGFVFNFVGHGILRRPSAGRQWIITQEYENPVLSGGRNPRPASLRSGSTRKEADAPPE